MWLLTDALAMIGDLRRNAPLIDIWGMVLNAPQLVGGLYFIDSMTGELVLAGVLASLVIASQIHKRRPFSRLAGACHIVWLPLIPLLGASIAQSNRGRAYMVWASYVAITMSISVILDVYDLYRFFFTDDKTYATFGKPVS